MRPIPLNIATLYADILQNLSMQELRPGSISTKTVDGKKYLYAVEKHGQTRIQRYLGAADDPAAIAASELVRQAEAKAKGLRSTVSALKQARVPAPSIVLGRILEVVAAAGLFDRGMTLVGTAAYQTYAPVLGYYLPASAVMTNDVDLSLAEFVEPETPEDIDKILKRADPTFAPKWKTGDQLPTAFQSSNGFMVDLLTRYGRGRKSPVQVPSLKCAAEALSFQEYLSEETIEAAALYGMGVLVRVPAPQRYATHKLIVAQQRNASQRAKKRKDLQHAKELIDIFLETDEVAIQDCLDAARARGRTWQSAINRSLREIGRDARQGRLPLPIGKSRQN
jgi:hypothetical protein